MRLPLARSDHAFGMRMLEEGFRTLHDVQSFRGVRNPARSQNARFSLAHRLAATFSGAGNGMSGMRVLRFASAARAGSAWMFGRRPGAPCSDTANTSVPWKESLQDTTRLYSKSGGLSRGRFDGVRVNVDQVPRLPMFPARWTLEDRPELLRLLD